MLVAQLRDQLQSAHCGHFLIDNETVAKRKIDRVQQLGSGREAVDGQALDFEREFERVADGEVIVHDDDHHGRTRRFASFFHGLAGL